MAPAKGSKPPDVVGMGAVAWDRFLVVPRFPKPDEKIRAIQCEECAGGTVATALVALQRWGLGTRLISTIGFDQESDRILEILHEEGIDSSHLVRRRDAEARKSVILVDNRNGDRCVVSGPHKVPPIEPGELKPEWFEGARVLHLDTTVDECGVEAARMARSLGMTVTLDAERMTPRIGDLLPQCDMVIASYDFAYEVTGQEKLSLAAYGLYLKSGRPTVVTRGREGCEYVSSELQFFQPAFKAPVVDGTGAGDVFHAAYIFGLLAAWDVREIVRFAAWAASQACRELSGRKGIPSADAVKEFHKRGEGKG
jgi:sulfofructose kinase